MNKVIVIVGPTAVGKTKLSIELAKKYDGEVINADSTQVYKNMDIATAKVTKEEMEVITHHLLDIKDIDEIYTVYDFQKDCRKKIEEIQKKGKTPIIVGGTGLYIKAALYDYKFNEESNSNEYNELSTEKLFEVLKKVDPNTEIHPNNRKRIVRSLNYYNENNEPMSLKEKSEKLLYDAVVIGLTTDRDILYSKINDRVDIMMKNGLINEAKNLYETNIRSKAVLTPIGYKELFPYFENNSSLEECINKIKQNSRRYAKRQYTWFKNQMNVNWFTTNYNDFNKTVLDIEKFIDEDLQN